MNDRALVKSLRARESDSLVALYDAYAESLYRYCRLMTGDADASRAALRDTLIAAGAHARSLADTDRFKAWLYAFARRECVRRCPEIASEAAPDRPATRPLEPERRRERSPAVQGAEGAGESGKSGKSGEVGESGKSGEVGGSGEAGEAGEGDPRASAREAVLSLSPREREVLELTFRHSVAVTDLAAVLGVSGECAAITHEAALARLRELVTVEIPPDRIFGLLPEETVPETLRVRVMSGLTDPDLALYRRSVARRAAAFDIAGFPVAKARRARRSAYALAGVAAAIGLIFAQMGEELAG